MNHKDAHYSSLQHYLSILGDEINLRKQKLSTALLKHPLQKSKREIDAFLPTAFSIIDFQVYTQLKLAAVVSIIASAHIGDKNLHAIRKKLNDLHYNRKKYEESNPAVILAPILAGKNDRYFFTLIKELGDYHDLCTSVDMMNKEWIKYLVKADREMIDKIRKGWLKEKRAMKEILVKKLKTEMLSINTYKENNTKAAGLLSI